VVVVVGSKAIIAMHKLIPSEQIETARMSAPLNKRPSFECCVAVLHCVAVYTVEARGYCDMSAQQLSDRMKGAWLPDSIQNALNCLTNGGILYTHKRGSMTAEGIGRASQRVLVCADSAALIPAVWVAPVPTLSRDSGIPDSCDHSQVEKVDSHGNERQLSRGTDLPTHYELTHKTPTAAAAEPLGAFHNNESQSLVMSDDTSVTRWLINADPSKVDKVYLAVFTRVPTATKQHRERIRTLARDAISCCLDASLSVIADMVEELQSHPPVGRTERLEAIKEAALRKSITFTQPEKEQTI
jgi:hypothetical protein